MRWRGRAQRAFHQPTSAEHHRQVARRAARCGSARPSLARRPAARRSASGRARMAIGSADRRPQRIAPADPSHIGRSRRRRCRRPRGRDVAVDTPTKCGADVGARRQRRPRATPRARRALASVSCVVKVFDTTTNRVVARVEPASARSRCSGSTLETKRTPGTVAGAPARAQRVADQARPEVGAADADVHDVADRRAGGAEARGRRGASSASAAMRALRRADRRASRRCRRPRPACRLLAQRRVQRRPALGQVDLLAGEQRGDPRRQARRRRRARSSAASDLGVIRSFDEVDAASRPTSTGKRVERARGSRRRARASVVARERRAGLRRLGRAFGRVMALGAPEGCVPRRGRMRCSIIDWGARAKSLQSTRLVAVRHRSSRRLGSPSIPGSPP